MGLKLQGAVPLIQVFDMPRSLAFYRDILGLEVVSSSDPARGDHVDWVMLRCDGGTLMLNTAYEADARPATLPEERFAAHEDTGLYFGCPDPDAAYEYVLSKGLTANPPAVAPYGMKQLWLRDPDGYVVCLQWPVNSGEISGTDE